MEASHKAVIDTLRGGGLPPRDELAGLIAGADAEARAYAGALAREVTEANFGDAVFLRGLIEFTNYCGNDCYYCGIRKSNAGVERYRLAPDEILACCREGYALGFRTFVLQGGEDGYWEDGRLEELIGSIRGEFPECAITLSLGERSGESYRRLRRAGADRYLLRHETADAEHYGRLHPAGMALESRLACLRALRQAGFQVGAGFMVGSPRQTAEHLAGEVVFLREFGPEMVGLGPFLPHGGTPFAGEAAGGVALTLLMLSLVRLALPFALLPATTALGSAEVGGRERGILAGANVVMPNLSPVGVRERYMLYDGKVGSGLEAAENVAGLRESLARIGRRVMVGRGDFRAL